MRQREEKYNAANCWNWNSGRLKEKQRIELETQKGMLDPADDNIILVVIDKMKKWFGIVNVKAGNFEKFMIIDC